MDMLIRHFMKPVILGFFYLSQVNGMETQENSLERLKMTLPMGEFQLRKADFGNLDESFKKAYSASTSDFGALQQMLGTFAACVFTPVQWFLPYSVYELFGQDMEERSKQGPESLIYDWILAHEGQFAGYIGLSLLSFDLPPKIMDRIATDRENLLCIEVVMGKDYRGKGIAKSLYPTLLKQLGNLTALKGKVLLIVTSFDNAPVHNLAADNGFKYVGRANLPLDLRWFTIDKECDFFIHKII